jgi:cytosine/adenosine deaminase-related metal-dependent hydrolase
MIRLDLAGHEVLPGFINAHDHLEFSLFPALGSGPYRNATEWARDIHHPERSPVLEHLRVPKPVRLWWGGLKNLLSGVTTVCHHNPYEPAVFTEDFPVRVVRRFGWAHSLAFEPDVAKRFRSAPLRYPFLIHCGEGTDTSARRELHELDAMGAVADRTVIVHGVAIRNGGLELMRRRRAALVWCPTSNLRLFGRTVSRPVLRSDILIALATDSALSAPVDLLDEMAVARRFLPANRVLEMVTTIPRRILRLPERRDWIAMTGASVALVVLGGRIRLISPELSRQLPHSARRRFQRIELEGRPPVMVEAPVRALRRAAEKHLGRDLRLAGKRILP